MTEEEKFQALRIMPKPMPGIPVSVRCWRNDGNEDTLIVGKEYRGVLCQGFISNYVEIQHELGFVSPIPTEYFVLLYRLTLPEKRL